MFDYGTGMKRGDFGSTGKYSLSPFRVRARTKDRSYPNEEEGKPYDQDHIREACNLPSNQISLEVAGGGYGVQASRLLKKESTEFRIIRKRQTPTREHMYKKMSQCRSRAREKTEATLLQQAQQSAETSKEYSENMMLIKELLARCNIKCVEQKQLDKLVHTYGLKIESMRYNISLRPKANQAQTQARNTQQEFMKTRVPSPQKPRNCEPVSLQSLSKRGVLSKFDVQQQSKCKFIKECSQSVDVTDTFNEALSLRLRKFREFLFLINLSNRIYRPLVVDTYPVPLKYWIGRGNNSQLVRSIISKRFWFVETSNIDESNFVWTQLKVQKIYAVQSNKGSTPDLSEQLCLPQPPTKKSRLNTTESEAEATSSFESLATNEDITAYKRHLTSIRQLKNQPTWDVRARMLGLSIAKPQSRQVQHNHLPNNGVLGNKKTLYYVLKEYCQLHQINLSSIVPLTFHVQRGVNDPVYSQFVEAFQQRKLRNGSSGVWIVKPGEHTNRGTGIACCNSLASVKKTITCKDSTRTFILQEYIANPLLYNGRKFDIRVYMLLTMSNGILKGYWYREGYVRTSSFRFELKHLGDPMIHLTNDAIQKQGESYGRYEEGNKLSFSDLNRYIRATSKGDFNGSILPHMKKVATQCIEAAYMFLDTDRKLNNFEIFGLDFMIDDALHPWLLEVNTNPCLEHPCGILQRLIPTMLENAFRIAVDPQFPAPSGVPWYERHNISENPAAFNKFELIFDELRDGSRLRHAYRDSKLADLIGNADQDKHQDEDVAPADQK